MSGSLANTSSASINNNLNYSSGSEDSFSISAGVEKQSSSSQFICDKMCLIIYELAHIRPALLDLVMPQIEYKLKSSDLKERREYTKLMSKMFSERDSRLAQQHQQLWEAYLERFADANEDIRRTCTQNIADFLIQQADSVKSAASTPTTSTAATLVCFYLKKNLKIIFMSIFFLKSKVKCTDKR